jgi:hypothetical protein
MRKQIPTPVPGGASLHNPQDAIRPSRTPLREGMEYYMLYDNRVMQAPNVPPPVRRSSLAQQTLIHRYQISKYFSRLRNFGMRPDHPAFHGFKIIVTGNADQTGVRLSSPNMNTPRPLAGAMRPPRRFKKALPSAPVTYIPPTY